MGWFDESDDDDDGDNGDGEPGHVALTNNTKINSNGLQLISHSSLLMEINTAGDAATTTTTEDEDPLDAFMKALQQPTTITTTAAGNGSGRSRIGNTPKATTDAASATKQTSQRLDIDNEEESTSHWNHGSSNNNDYHGNGTGRKSPSLADGMRGRVVVSAAAAAAAAATAYAPFTKQFWTAENTAAGRAWRTTHKVTCSAAVDPIVDFAQLQCRRNSNNESNNDSNSDVFGAPLWHAIHAQLGTAAAPTLVQSQTLSVALTGRDALVTACTGQGKTLAFVWPAAVHVAGQRALQKGETGPLAVILVPTRELALQVQKQAKPMLTAVGKQTKAVIGGQGRYILQQELKRSGGVDLVVATPGRLVDVLSNKAKGLSLQRVTMVILDEADKMLQMGFETQVRQILSQTRPDRQTMLFSATMGRRVEKVAAEWMQRDYVRVSVGRTGALSQNVEQHVMVVPNEDAKRTFLMEMLPTFKNVGRTLVFCATRVGCEALVTLVREQLPQLKADSLHGDKHQSDRNAALRAFRKGEIFVLFATDVAARGLDVPQVATVLNFNAAKDYDAHVHRCGRAGRLKNNEQQTGSAYTLLTPKNADFAHVLQSAFEREGRPVAPELIELAQKSRRRGGTGVASGGKGGGKVGLEFGKASTPVDNVASRGSYYGPPSGDAPPPKRSRWS
jgi:ATP-dependent RNA helicase DDX42